MHISGQEATYMAIESDERRPVKIEPLPADGAASAASMTTGSAALARPAPVRPSRGGARHGRHDHGPWQPMEIQWWDRCRRCGRKYRPQDQSYLCDINDLIDDLQAKKHQE
jgi:hypothetical protein